MKWIEFLVNNTELWKYNFEWECKALQPYKTFERYFRYKASAEDLDTSSNTYCEAEKFIKLCQIKYKGADCDNCELMTKIYSVLWKHYKWRSDTMNSVQTPMAELVHFCFGKDKKAKLKGNYNSRKYLIQCFCGENCKNFQEELDNTKGLHDYVDAYHTLGNFVLVPKGFNGDSGPYGELKVKFDDNSELSLQDFWDLSLEYLKKNNYKDFNKDKFKKYINYFFLWDYVEPDNNDSYKVKPIGMEKLTDDRNLPDFFTEATKRILRRGKFMTAMLMIHDKNSGLYSEIQNAYFVKNEALFDGIAQAAKAILTSEFGEKIPDNARSLLNELKSEQST